MKYHTLNERPENLSLDDVFVEGSMVEEIDESDVHLFNYKNKNYE